MNFLGEISTALRVLWKHHEELTKYRAMKEVSVFEEPWKRIFYEDL